MKQISISAEALLKITEKQFCFQFEDGRTADVPRSEMQNVKRGDTITFTLPMWLVNATELHDYII